MHQIAIIEILAQIYFIVHAIKANKPRYWIPILLIPWVGFIIYFVVEFLPKLQQDQNTINSSSQACDLGQLEDQKVAYLSQGRLFYKSNSSPSTEIQSHFGQKIIDQTIRLQQKNEWKTKGSGSYFGGSALWGIDQMDTDAVKVTITGATRDQMDDRFYFIISIFSRRFIQKNR